MIDGLNNNGVFLMQTSHLCEDGVIVETLFIHESGEQVSAGKLHVPASKQDAQGYGSALTYARRYALMAACGIAPEDDDGNAASRKPEPKPEAKPEPKPEPKQEKPPAKVEGKEGKWQISVKSDESVETGDWLALVKQATELTLGLDKSQADVMEIFKVNRALFDTVKSLSEESHTELMGVFKQKKDSFK